MGNTKIDIELPWPPTVNTYWRKSPRGMFISKRGKEYAKEVFYICNKYRYSFTDNQRLSISILAFPPDKRKRDLDNIFKGLLDSLVKANVLSDDEQIDELHIKRMKAKKGVVLVQIRMFND